MKKLFALVLALAMCMSAFAMADAPSITADDLNKPSIEIEDVKPGFENATVTVTSAQDNVVFKAVIDAQIAKMSADVDAYFGEFETADGSKTTISELVGGETVVVHDVFAFNVEGVQENCGEMDLKIKVATTFEKDTVVVVLIGIVSLDGTVAWTPFEGVVLEDGKVQLTLPEEVLLQVQNNIALMAVVTK